MKRYILLILTLSALNAQTLTLNECVSRALDTHPVIKNFALDVTSCA